MRRALAVTAVLCALASPAAADDPPPGAIGFVFGVVSGTGADAKRLGFGLHQFGMQASWQSPFSPNGRLGWSVRWGTLFGILYGGNAAQIDAQLHTVQLDLTAGVRFRPWDTPTRYLTARVGGEMFRSNEPIPPLDTREFVGGIASVGLDQYFSGVMLSVDVQYGLFGKDNPTELALQIGIGLTGP